MHVSCLPSTISELQSAPGIERLLAIYASECAIAGMPPPRPHWPMYQTLEDAGVLHTFLYHVDDRLVGFALMIVSLNPHYSAPIGVTESIFVDPECEVVSDAGSSLLRNCYYKARELGAVGFLISAPAGGRLAALLGKKAAYVRTNEAYFRSLA